MNHIIDIIALGDLSDESGKKRRKNDMVSKMGDYACTPDFYQTENDGQSYFYLLVGVSILTLAMIVINLS